MRHVKFLQSPLSFFESELVIGLCITRDIMCKFFKIFYFLKWCSDLWSLFAFQFGDYNIHDNIKVLYYSQKSRDFTVPYIRANRQIYFPACESIQEPLHFKSSLPYSTSSTVHSTVHPLQPAPAGTNPRSNGALRKPCQHSKGKILISSAKISLATTSCSVPNKLRISGACSESGASWIC